MQEKENIKNLGEIKKIIGDFKRKGRKVVWTNGCFDILHLGHAKYLKKAKEFGDVLIVGLNSDDSIKKIKGPNRPINNENDRAVLLSMLKPVDYVLIFSEQDCCTQLKELRPDFYVKGGDYTIETINQKERKIIESYGGKVKLVPIVNGKSTTLTIDKIKNNH